jgi:hypothetical protein
MWNWFEIQEPVSEGRTLAIPVENRVTIRQGPGSQQERRGAPRPGQKGKEHATEIG